MLLIILTRKGIKMYSIKKQFKCEYAHRLYNLCGTDSPCQNLHGHSAKIEVEIFTDQLNENNMVIDFTKLREIQEWLDKHFDHATILNELDYDMVYALNHVIEKNPKLKPLYLLPADPTAEILSKIIYQFAVLPVLKKNNLYITKTKVTFYETANNCATFEV